jgi:hypothetical protein
VNYATNPAAFDRSLTHTDPFSTVSEASFGSSHDVLLTGLTPNTTYHFEVIAETPRGPLGSRRASADLYEED